MFYGPQQRAEAAIIPIALLEALAPYLEDIALAETLRQRRAQDNGVRHTLAELDALHGFDSAAVDAAKVQLQRDLGLTSLDSRGQRALAVARSRSLMPRARTSVAFRRMHRGSMCEHAHSSTSSKRAW